MIARSAPSRSSPAPSARRYAALGLDRSARPSKRGNHAANAYLTMLARTEDKRSSDSVRQVEYWFPHIDPAPILIGQHRKVLHGLHVSPAHQRLLRERNADLFSRARFGLEQTATIAYQLPRASRRVRADGQAGDESQTDHRQSASHSLEHAGCRGPRVAASGDASALWMEFP